jgi:hypothetical protein
MAGTGRQHLEEAGMSYGAHLKRAWSIGGPLLVAGGACLVHGLFPSLFTTTATRTIVRLNEEVKKAPAHGGQPFMLEFEI